MLFGNLCGAWGGPPPSIPSIPFLPVEACWLSAGIWALPRRRRFPQGYSGDNAAAFFFKRILVFWNSLHQWVLSGTFFNIVLYFFRTLRHLQCRGEKRVKKEMN